jgi:ssDNA-binding Zn-finger/Zn-ribbon topoisomerase 1
MADFGECPECGKMTLIRTKRRLHYIFSGEPGDLVIYVKCINCDFEKEIRRIPKDELEEDLDIDED